MLSKGPLLHGLQGEQRVLLTGVALLSPRRDIGLIRHPALTVVTRKVVPDVGTLVELGHGGGTGQEALPLVESLVKRELEHGALSGRHALELVFLLCHDW